MAERKKSQASGARKKSGTKKATPSTTKAKPRLSAAAQLKRDAAVVKDRAIHRLTWAEIQEKYGVPERTGRDIMARWREQQHETLDQVDPIGEIAEMLLAYDDVIATYTALRERHMPPPVEAPLDETVEEAARRKRHSPDGNPTVVLGANAGIARTIERRAWLLQAAGLLPKNLGSLKVEYDVRFLGHVIFQVFQKYEVPVAARDEIMDALRQRIASASPYSASTN